MSTIKVQSGLLGLCLALSLSCGQDDPLVRGGDDLTSKAAVERNLTIKSFVYVAENASDYTVKSAVTRQIRTAFGPLRIAKISVDDRELKNNVDPTTFTSQQVEVMKKDAQGNLTSVKKVKKVSYTYKARALVVKSKANKTSFSLALLMGSYQSFVSEIIKKCVENYEHDQEFASSFWYVFSPNEHSCQQLINDELTEIQSERTGLTDTQVGEKELERRFLPVTAKLEAVTAPKTTYPEYDRLYKLSDPTADRIKVYQIMGVASHAGDPDDERFENDLGFKEFFKGLKILADTWASIKVAANSDCDPFSFTYDGTSYTTDIAEAYKWVVKGSGFPAAIPADEEGKFLRAFYDNLVLKWIKLEVPLDVKASHVSRRMTLELNYLFGTESGYSVRSYFRKAFKSGDVVLYNGHSYIGSGPLDPNNYSANDFPNKYQIFFFNSCVSYNYYGVDYFDLKSGGTQQLDLVNNGIEVYISNGGMSMAQFITAVFDKQPQTWLKILARTQVKNWYSVHDPNRAVDGEQDNSYDPTKTPIEVKEGTADLTVNNSSTACGAAISGKVKLTATSTTAARVSFLVDGVEVGSDTSSPFGLSWDSTGVADGSVTITARAYDSAGNTAEDACTATVQNGGGGGGADLFSDDMESGSSSWTATGFWHLAQSSSCASPAYASATSAWYFGQASTCNYKSSAAVKGTLTSVAINAVSASSKLSFKFYRDVESHSGGGYDKTAVEVSEDGSGSWKSVWSRDCKDASAKAWKSSGDISLAAWAGKSIKIRFSFDSVDNYGNDTVGWMIDDVKVTP